MLSNNKDSLYEAIKNGDAGAREILRYTVIEEKFFKNCLPVLKKKVLFLVDPLQIPSLRCSWRMKNLPWQVLGYRRRQEYLKTMVGLLSQDIEVVTIIPPLAPPSVFPETLHIFRAEDYIKEKDWQTMFNVALYSWEKEMLKILLNIKNLVYYSLDGSFFPIAQAEQAKFLSAFSQVTEIIIAGATMVECIAGALADLEKVCPRAKVSLSIPGIISLFGSNCKEKISIPFVSCCLNVDPAKFFLEGDNIVFNFPL